MLGDGQPKGMVFTAPVSTTDKQIDDLNNLSEAENLFETIRLGKAAQENPEAYRDALTQFNRLSCEHDPSTKNLEPEKKNNEESPQELFPQDVETGNDSSLSESERKWTQKNLRYADYALFVLAIVLMVCLIVLAITGTLTVAGVAVLLPFALIVYAASLFFLCKRKDEEKKYLEQDFRNNDIRQVKG